MTVTDASDAFATTPSVAPRSEPTAPTTAGAPVSCEELSFASADGASTIHARIWWPADPAARTAPRGVVQLVHGMSEHVGRYDAFARFLAERGFVVAADDHIGHGASAAPERRGVLPAHGGADALVADEHQLRGLLATRVAEGTPYVFFGHSMGSFITRAYLAEHGDGVAAAVICGTGTVPALTSHAANLLARLLSAVRGEDFRSKLIDSMGVGAYARQVDSDDDLAWLSVNPDNVAAYRADEACGFMFSVGGYATLTELTARACSLACAQAVPHNLPLLFVSGEEDPVGDMGAGVRKAAELAHQGGSRDVTVRLYKGMRHEILNERNGRRVMEDVLAWIEQHLPEAASAPGTTTAEGSPACSQAI